MGRYEDAVQALQRYAFYAPEQANPHDSLGEAFLYTGRYEEAIQEFVKALEIDPTFVWSAMHLADVLGVTGQFDKARQVLAQVEPVIEERGWQNWWAMTSMRLDFRAEHWEDLLLAANANLEGITDDERTGEFALWSQYTRTIAQLEMGNLEDAMVSVEELQAVAAKFAEERSEYAQTSDIMRLNEAYVVSRFQRATGHPAGGIEGLWDAVRESDLSPHELSMFRYELAEALLADSRPKEAVEVTHEMLDRIPNAPMMNLVAAKAHLALGEREDSLEHLQKYLEAMRLADQGNPRVAEAQQLLQRLVPRS
jgi:tetratricopeptide (TPR) repeat protein